MLNREPELLLFIESAITDFLLQNPELVYYAFALDCESAYGNVNLCFNTEEAFYKTLNEYQAGAYSSLYQDRESLYELKYNTGDWKYQCFNSIDLYSEGELASIYGDDYELWSEEFMLLCSKTLIEFLKSDCYNSIPKTDNFKVICINHDEDFFDSEERLKEILL